ncbi:MAG: NAD-dependent epimerase/dehydratase family protein [Planctomycetales bacterium]
MIYVLGGGGFYGSALVRQLAAQGRELRIVSRDNYAALRGSKCDLFINANGNSSKPLARRDPLADFDASVRSVRASLLDFEFDSYLYLSSVDVYPDGSPSGANGESSELPPDSQSVYGFHKRLAEQCVQQGAARWLICRLGGAVGPGLKKNAIYDMLHGGPLWLDPQSCLQFLQTDDAARLMLDLVDRGIRQDVFNVCGHGSICLQDALDLLPAPIPVQPGSPKFHSEVTIDKLQRLCPVPETRATVLEFVRTSLAARKEEIVDSR